MFSIVDSAVHVGNTQTSIGTEARPSHQTVVVKQRLRLAGRARQLYGEQEEDHGSFVVPGTLGTVRTLQQYNIPPGTHRADLRAATDIAVLCCSITSHCTL